LSSGKEDELKKERKKEEEEEGMRKCVCVCVCVREREREKSQSRASSNYIGSKPNYLKRRKEDCESFEVLPSL
jgi:hypothetical protein